MLNVAVLRKTLKMLSGFNPTLPALRLGAVAVALAVFSVSAQAPLHVRVALIIGNSANDARAMAVGQRGLALLQRQDALFNRALCHQLV